MPGTLFFIDFKKAYKLEWNYVQKCLKYFGFADDLRKWVQPVYTQISTCITNNGHISKYFDLSRGVRRGCQLSCYIFILCSKLMAISLRCNNNVKGISIDNNIEIKITEFANDTTLILDGSESSITKCY